MSGGVTAATVATYATAAAAVVSAYGTLTNKPPKPPEILAPEKPPQVARTPDAAATRKNSNPVAALAGGGSGSTFLTGAGGIPTDALNLGKSTLLGQ